MGIVIEFPADAASRRPGSTMDGGYREGAATVEMSSAQFADYIRTEIEKWGRVVKEGNIHPQ